MRWLVDGFNVVLSDEKLSRRLRNDSKAGRTEFISEIVGSGQFRNEEVTVFFDGRFTASSDREAPGVTVRFTANGETADDAIKREIGRHTRRRSLLVVSDDRSIVSYARECGAKTMSTADFLAKVRNKVPARPLSAGSPSEKPESTGTADPELLRLFTGKKK